MNLHALRRATLTAALLAVTLFINPLSAQAQLSVHAEVSPQAGDTEDSYSYVVVIEGARSAAAPELSGGADFAVRYIGPNSFMSIINGSVTAKTSHIFQMTPRKEGDLLTPSARVTVEGRSYDVAPLEVHVTKGQPVLATDGKPGEAEIIFRQSATPSTAYEGQQIINIVDLYTAISLAELAPIDLTTDGFWQESISDGDRAQRNVNGRPYETIQFVKALYPLASGTLLIPARRFRAKAVRASRAQRVSGFDPFDPFGNDLIDQLFQRPVYEDVSLLTNQVTLSVKPLPPASAEIQQLLGPAPLVGQTAIAVDSDVSIGRVGESKTITFQVTTEGNLNPLLELPIAAPNGLKVYPERAETKLERRAGKLIFRRSFPFSVVPLKPGLIKIPPVRLAYFDPEKGQYEITESKEIAFAAQGESLIDDDGKPLKSSSSSVSAIPTLPPLPIGPDLEYQEETLLEGISSAISLKSALLIAALLIGVGILFAIGSRIRPAPAPQGLAPADLDGVETLAQLEDFLRRLATNRIPSLRQDASLDEIRARVSAQTKDLELSLSICAVFDELELLRYGSPGQAENRHAAASLKPRVQLLLRSWQPIK